MVLMFKAVRDSDWSADHVGAHDVTLDEVRQAILERPYWAARGRDGTVLVYGRTSAGATCWWWPSPKAGKPSSSPPAT